MSRTTPKGNQETPQLTSRVSYLLNNKTHARLHRPNNPP